MMNLQSDIYYIESGLTSWHPRDIIRFTNWIYYIYALCNHEIREMHIILEVASLFEGYATQIIIWAYAIRLVTRSTQYDRLSDGLQKIIQMIINMTELFWSEAIVTF